MNVSLAWAAGAHGTGPKWAHPMVLAPSEHIPWDWPQVSLISHGIGPK